jgi:membrane protein DedA with SNARE-associated domain/pimeloyl-ACP methyl ester carboxylesterase
MRIHLRYSRWYVISLYLLLLLISHGIRQFHPIHSKPDPAYQTVSVQAVAGEQQLEKTVQIAYRELKPSRIDDPPSILLINGSPPNRSNFYKIEPVLASHYRIIIPDMPGFGSSTHELPDYSIRAHAWYFVQLLDKLQLDRIHIIGYGQGGGVALNMVDITPGKVASMIMLSAIGVVELELLGDYYLNHALHGLQLGLIWFIQEFTPHFGYLDDIFLNYNYARNFYDSDQRPLREILKDYKNSMLILHGIKDRLVPQVAAEEHYRLVPQSELAILDSGHKMVQLRGQELAQIIADFVQRVEKGATKIRNSADSKRIVHAAEPFDSVIALKAEGIAILILLLLFIVCTQISEDLTCIGAGLIVARGILNYLPATIACIIGIFVGDLALYLAGKYLGKPVVKRVPFKWMIKEKDLERSAEWFEARGPVIIFTSRFLPGSRLPTYFAAGVLESSLSRFAFWLLIAAVVWTPLLVGLATVLGHTLFDYFALYQKFALSSVFFIFLFIFLLLRIAVPMLSFKGRRLLLSSYRRIIHYEFWPTYVFYIPIALYIIYLGLRHRSLTMFTAANPGIPESGLVGESKSQILDSFHAEREIIARYRLIKYDLELSEKVSQAINFMSELEASFPVVLKPDSGERGTGVAIIKSKDQLENYLAQVEDDTIIQENIEGYEYGVFYYRYPGQNKGHIFKITDKRRLKLIGDGRSNLETLILKDDRAVCKAPLHLKVHQKRLFDVPAKGKEIKLVEVGAHARGALFLDGNYVWTPELEKAIDKVSKGFHGFYFGRYDVRTPSIEDFKQGKNFKVVELNGVTSEATDIYDPKNSIWYAYKVLMKQWKIAFEIGYLNTQKGVEPASIKQLFKLLVQHL